MTDKKRRRTVARSKEEVREMQDQLEAAEALAEERREWGEQLGQLLAHSNFGACPDGPSCPKFRGLLSVARVVASLALTPTEAQAKEGV